MFATTLSCGAARDQRRVDAVGQRAHQTVLVGETCCQRIRRVGRRRPGCRVDLAVLLRKRETLIEHFTRHHDLAVSCAVSLLCSCSPDITTSRFPDKQRADQANDRECRECGQRQPKIRHAFQSRSRPLLQSSTQPASGCSMPAARKPPVLATLVAMPACRGGLTSFAHAHASENPLPRAPSRAHIASVQSPGTPAIHATQHATIASATTDQHRFAPPCTRSESAPTATADSARPITSALACWLAATVDLP